MRNSLRHSLKRAVELEAFRNTADPFCVYIESGSFARRSAGRHADERIARVLNEYCTCAGPRGRLTVPPESRAS
jgi:hypothetical protein